MIHPSYSELMQEVNRDTETDEPPVVNSRYSIVLATSKRARQIIGGDTPLVPNAGGKKPLSIAIDELYRGEVKIMPEDAKRDGGDEEENSDTESGEEDVFVIEDSIEELSVTDDRLKSGSAEEEGSEENDLDGDTSEEEE